jgi:hypothetical protein
MLRFQQWLLNKRVKEENNIINKFNINPDNKDFAEDQEQVEKQLLKIVLRKYPEETMDFLSTIAQRGDSEVASLLRKVDRSEPRSSIEPQHPDENDAVVIPAADAGFSDSSDV